MTYDDKLAALLLFWGAFAVAVAITVLTDLIGERRR